MADDRFYLRCKKCDETFYLAKRTGGGVWCPKDDEDHIYDLTEFLTDHVIGFCSDGYDCIAYIEFINEEEYFKSNKKT